MTFGTQAYAGNEARVLRLVPGLCSDTKVVLEQWARTITGHGAYAAPVAPRSMKVSCSNPGPAVSVGQSYGFSDVWEAEQAALKYCEDHKPADYPGCVIIARFVPGKR